MLAAEVPAGVLDDSAGLRARLDHKRSLTHFLGRGNCNEELIVFNILLGTAELE